MPKTLTSRNEIENGKFGVFKASAIGLEEMHLTSYRQMLKCRLYLSRSSVPSHARFLKAITVTFIFW